MCATDIVLSNTNLKATFSNISIQAQRKEGNFLFFPFWRGDLTSAFVKMRSTVILLQLSNYSLGCRSMQLFGKSGGCTRPKKKNKQRTEKCVCPQLIIQHNTMDLMLSNNGYPSYLWAQGDCGTIRSSHSPNNHPWLRMSCVSLGKMGAAFVKRRYWALQALWMSIELVSLLTEVAMVRWFRCITEVALYNTLTLVKKNSKKLLFFHVKNVLCHFSF